jgi:hypothetical protein
MMKAIPILLASAFALPGVRAVTLVSNLDRVQTGTIGNTSNSTLQNSLWAFQFTTGSAASTVTGLTAALGNYAGTVPVTAVFEAGIWTNASGPSSQLATFSNTPTVAGSTVNNVADVSFTSSGINLAANTSYWVVLRNTAASGTQFAFDWGGTNQSTESSAYGWTIADAHLGTHYRFSVNGGSSWIDPGDSVSNLKFSLEGTVVPEPSSLMMLAVAAGGLIVRRRRGR